MFRLFRLSLKARKATQPYPFVPEPAPEVFRGQVMLRTDRCCGSSDCARACPSSAIDVVRTASASWTWSLDDARCVFCGLCAEACPHQAITLSNEFELATRDPHDLVTCVTFAVESRPEKSR